jgi:hypothetical protein
MLVGLLLVGIINYYYGNLCLFLSGNNPSPLDTCRDLRGLDRMHQYSHSSTLSSDGISPYCLSLSNPLRSPPVPIGRGCFWTGALFLLEPILYMQDTDQTPWFFPPYVITLQPMSKMDEMVFFRINWLYTQHSIMTKQKQVFWHFCKCIKNKLMSHLHKYSDSLLTTLMKHLVTSVERRRQSQV